MSNRRLRADVEDSRVRVLPCSDLNNSDWTEAEHRMFLLVWRLIASCALVTVVLIIGAVGWAISLRR